jgi:putative tricarboxylic transport membrane protein
VYSLSGSGYEVLMALLTVLALFVPYLPKLIARIRGTEPSRDRLTFGEDD